MKLQVLIELNTTDQSKEEDVLSQLTYATKCFEESMKTPSNAELLQISMPNYNPCSVNKDNLLNTNKMAIGNLEVDLKNQEVRAYQKLVDLTPMEYKLLVTLMENRGEVQSREKLLNTVWKMTSQNTRTVDVHCNRLRAKLGAAGFIIQTVFGTGYIIK